MTNKVSIHTPTKGVTLANCLLVTVFIVSIHTPTKGVTLDITVKSIGMLVSIHTPTKGVTSPGAKVRAYF